MNDQQGVQPVSGWSGMMNPTEQGILGANSPYGAYAPPGGQSMGQMQPAGSPNLGAMMALYQGYGALAGGGAAAAGGAAAGGGDSALAALA
jgi:hypothetical protein